MNPYIAWQLGHIQGQVDEAAELGLGIPHSSLTDARQHALKCVMDVGKVNGTPWPVYRHDIVERAFMDACALLTEHGDAVMRAKFEEGRVSARHGDE